MKTQTKKNDIHIRIDGPRLAKLTHLAGRYRSLTSVITEAIDLLIRHRCTAPAGYDSQVTIHHYGQPLNSLPGVPASKRKKKT